MSLRFAGTISELTITLNQPKLTDDDRKERQEANRAALDANWTLRITRPP